MIKKQKLDISAAISRIALFSQLPPEPIRLIAAETRERNLVRGDILFQKGDILAGFFVIVSGQIKLAFASAQGNEKVVEVMGPGQSFGEAVMFMSKPCPVLAQAVTNTTLLQIPKAQVTSVLKSDPDFAQAMLAGMALRLHSLIKDLESYSLRSSAQRVIGYLLQLLPDNANGPADLILPISKQVIASRLNLTPETLSRIFHDLTDLGLIEIKGKVVHVLDVANFKKINI
jgi:CRP-like cAMP-binding protein